MKKMTTKKIKCVDFFCGGGGMSLGMNTAGLDVVAAIDNDPKCEETYKANHPCTLFLRKDIKKYNVEQLRVEAGIKRNDPRLVFIGCAPCQYWSIITGANLERKKKSKSSRNLLRHFLRFVEYYRPGYVIIENVRGIYKNKEKSGLSEVLEFFDASGYNYIEKVVPLSKYGVPQTRQRYILIATRNGDIQLPEPDKKYKPTPTVRSEIEELKKISAGEIDPDDKLHRSAKLSEINIKRLKLTPEGGTRDSWSKKEELLINAYRDKPSSFFRDNYGRMSWDALAPTITTRFYSVGCGKFGHPEQHRCISLREGALLQTFPLEYEFKTTSLQHTARIIGNAVPPRFAERLGSHIIAHANGKISR